MKFGKFKLFGNDYNNIQIGYIFLKHAEVKHENFYHWKHKYAGKNF